MRATRKLAFWAFLAIVCGATAFYIWRDDLVASSAPDSPRFRVASIERGDVDATVNASGTLKATVTVEVGAQVTGQIRELLVDYNSPVKKGQIVARIDPKAFQSRVDAARADLKVSQATVAMQAARIRSLAADARAARATFKAAERNFKRKRELFGQRITSRAELDKAVQSHEEARARLDSAKAKLVEQASQLNIARAQVDRRKAMLKQTEIDLEHTIIRAPVDGIVIARQVDRGQTVSAATTAPTLFKIAGDLTRMQVEVGVDEADIGRIQEGQNTFFTVDTFPGQRFPGTVIQVRKEPKEVQSVVTYTVIISAQNPDNRLLPGMTANVTFYVSRRRAVLKVANSALRFRPPDAAPSGAGPGRPSPAMLRAMREARQKAWRKMVKQLSLTTEQQAQIRQTEKELRREMRKIFAGMRTAPDPKRMRKAMRELVRQRRAAFLQILKPDQREKYLAQRAESRNRNVRPATLYKPGPNGRPVPVPVLIGATDGVFTEVVAAPLKAGDKVLTGILRGASRPRS